jgi:ADP-ribose pyrophosphatase
MRTIIPPGARLIPGSAKKVFTGKIYDVYQWEQELYDGSTDTFEMLGRPDTIQVLAIDGDKIVFLKEQQPSLGAPFYGLPGGRHDVTGESELDAARREMREETGLEFENWKLISVEQPHTKIEWFVYLFLATGVKSRAPQNLDAGEKIEVLHLTLAEAKRLSHDPAVRHLPTELLDGAESLNDLLGIPAYPVTS